MLENWNKSAVDPDPDQPGVPVRASYPLAIAEDGVRGIAKPPEVVPDEFADASRTPAFVNGAVCLEEDSANTGLGVLKPYRLKAPVSTAAFLTRILRYFAYNPQIPLRCGVMFPILSITSAVSSIRVRTDGARAFVFVVPVAMRVLSRSAKQAAKETMMAELFGMESSCFSPCTAARMTFSAAERPAVRKNCRTSSGAVG